MEKVQSGTNGRRSDVKPSFCYAEAFSRHRGLLTQEEQEQLRGSRVAIIGMGGVGGVHLMTLTRLGIGRFTIADPDRFELANFNRQYGASMRTLGEKKVDVMMEEALAVNPGLDIRRIDSAIDSQNVADFLNDADILVDGVDFFAIDARRVAFAEARRRRIWAITAGPICFGVAWLAFSPSKMSFDEYFDLHDSMTWLEQIAAFSVGLLPRPIHLRYMDLSGVTAKPGQGASLGLACQLCSGIVATEVARILLKRPGIRAAPCYSQFDAYRGKLARGRLWMANRNPIQRLKRLWMKRHWEARTRSSEG